MLLMVKTPSIILSTMKKASMSDTNTMRLEERPMVRLGMMIK